MTLDRDEEEFEAAIAWWHRLSDSELLSRLVQRGWDWPVVTFMVLTRHRPATARRITEVLGAD
jgi:hypothetical protein